jgi:hypothetical protein
MQEQRDPFQNELLGNDGELEHDRNISKVRMGYDSRGTVEYLARV